MYFNPTFARHMVLLLTILCVSSALFSASAKEEPLQVLVWPTTGTPVLRFSFGKFKEAANLGKSRAMTTEVTAQNVWTKKISRADFVVYFYDKNKVRIGQGWINVADVSPSAMVKFQFSADVSGSIASMEIAPQALGQELQAAAPPKAISVTVNSVPQGADVKLDGTPAGTTPKIVQVLPGKHELLFTKEGYKSGTFPLETTLNDVSGGSVSYELGASAYDSVELRDGSVLSGDVESLSNTEVMIRVGGVIQNIDRNKVKRISLIQRDAPTPQ